MKNNYTQSTWVKPDVALENKLRPPSLDDFFGQEQLKQRLKISIGASKKRGDVLAHTLFYGPPGLGKTTLANIISHEMGSKLVVLSACETGLGKIESSEGTFGLKRGFKLAGVDQIIVSLWKVPDNESMELMTLFYSELAKSNNIDSSFSKAQKVMRNRYPFEPEKWAGFVLVR